MGQEGKLGQKMRVSMTAEGMMEFILRKPTANIKTLSEFSWDGSSSVCFLGLWARLVFSLRVRPVDELGSWHD